MGRSVTMQNLLSKPKITLEQPNVVTLVWLVFIDIEKQVLLNSALYIKSYFKTSKGYISETCINQH